MIQKLTTLLFILCLTLSVQAQKKPGFSKEEFRAKQEAYLTQKAELTAEEAGKFFPIYFELQDRKKAGKKHVKEKTPIPPMLNTKKLWMKSLMPVWSLTNWTSNI